MGSNQFQAVFVVRGGKKYGMGHLVRSVSLGEKMAGTLGNSEHFLTIANKGAAEGAALSGLGWPVRFIDFEEGGDLAPLRTLWRDISSDVTVIDHLEVAEEEKRIVTSRSARAVLFDDLEQSVPQNEVCHVVVQCQHFQVERFGESIEGAGTHYLRGPRYFVLKPDFDVLMKRRKKVPPKVTSLFVSIGGSNYRGAMAVIAREIRKIYRGNLILAAGFDPRERQALVETLGKYECIRILQDQRLFTQALFNADLAVIGGGFIKYEAAALGVPSLIMGFEDHQEFLSRHFESFGSSRWLGMFHAGTLERMKNEIRDLNGAPEAREIMMARGRSLVPANGADEIAGIISKILPS